MKKLNKKGFTIIELVIVIAVIAILAGVMIPTFSSIVTKANESAAKQEAMAYYKEVYALDLSDGELDGNDKAQTIEYKEKTSDEGEQAVTTKTNQINKIGDESIDSDITIEYVANNKAVVSFKFENDKYIIEYKANTSGTFEWTSTKK